jgi:hypothetical protein
MTGPIPITYCGLFTVYPIVTPSSNLLEKVLVVTDQTDVIVNKGHEGALSELPFSDKITTPRLIVKCLTNREQTSLSRLILLSRDNLPFEVVICKQVSKL